MGHIKNFAFYLHPNKCSVKGAIYHQSIHFTINLLRRKISDDILNIVDVDYNIQCWYLNKFLGFFYSTCLNSLLKFQTHSHIIICVLNALIIPNEICKFCSHFIEKENQSKIEVVICFWLKTYRKNVIVNSFFVLYKISYSN